mgnify:CR=1 FL=1
MRRLGWISEENSTTGHIPFSQRNRFNIAKQQREIYDDLENDLYLILLQTDNEKLNYLYENKQLDFYINRILCNQLKSTTSPFYRTYIKNGLIQDEITKQIEEEYEDR